MADFAVVTLPRDLFAFVDAEDFAEVSKHRWHIRGTDIRYMYAQARVDGKKLISLHRFVLKQPPGVIIDHINHLTLDCRKSNLRVATASQNISNSYRVRKPKSGYRGVNRLTPRSFHARISHEGREIFGPCRTCIVQAARDYDEIAIKLKGEFAVLNFPHEHSGVS